MDWLVSLSTRPVWFYYTEPAQPPPLADLRNYAAGMHQPDLPQARKQTLVRWYWAPPGAQPLPYKTCYRSTLALSELEVGQQLLGEIPRYTKTFTDGFYVDGTADPKWTRSIVPLGATGQQPCGAPELWDGPLNGAPALVRGPGGLPVCCNPALGAAMGMGSPTYPTPTPTPARGALVMAGLEFPERTEAPMAMTAVDVSLAPLAATGADVAIAPLAMGFESPGSIGALVIDGADVAQGDALVLSGPPRITSAIGDGGLVAESAALAGDGQYGEQGTADLAARSATLTGAGQSGVRAAAGLVAGHAALAAVGREGFVAAAAALTADHAKLAATATFTGSAKPNCTTCTPPSSTLHLSLPAGFVDGTSSAQTVNLNYNSKGGDWGGNATLPGGVWGFRLFCTSTNYTLRLGFSALIDLIVTNSLCNGMMFTATGQSVGGGHTISGTTTVTW